MIKAEHDGQYKQVGFIKVRQPDGTYKDVEKKYGKTTGGEYGLVFEKGFTRELEGELPLVINGIGKLLKDCDIEGNIYQSDGVTPDTPQEVVGCGDKTKNLFSSEWEQGYLNVNGDAVDDVSRIRTADYIPITPNTVYSVKRSVYSNYINLRLYDKDKNFLAIGGDDTIELITGYTSANPMKAGQYFCCFKVILADAVFIKFCDLSNDLSTEYMMVEGEYTASTMSEFEPYGYKVDVVSRGKNLWNLQSSYSFTTYYDINVNINAGHYLSYIIETNGTTDIYGGTGCQLTFSDNTTQYVLFNATYRKSILLSKDVKIVRVYAGKDYTTSAGFTATVSEIMVSANADDSYEPYHEPYHEPIYLDTPLYSGDVLSYSGQKVTRGIKELILTGEEDWVYGRINEHNVFRAYLAIGAKTNNVEKCTHYIARYTDSDNSIYVASPTETGRVIIVDDRLSSVDDFKAFLADQYANGTPVTVYYVLAEPETKAVDTVEIPTLNGTTVIDANTEVKPSNMWVEYKSSK